MSRLIVVTAAYTTTDEHAILRESCNRKGLPFLAYGVGQPFPRFVEGKMKRLADELEHVEQEVVLYSDGFDSIVLAGAEEILKKWDAFNSGVVLSAEKNCFPIEDLAAKYPQIEGPWRFVNAGGFIGYRTYLIDALRYMIRTYDDEDDQARWSKAFIDGQLLATVDSTCQIFQTMGGAKDDDVEYTNNRIHNTVHDSYPSVVHFNGRKDGIEKLAKYSRGDA